MTRHEATCRLVVGLLGLKIHSGKQEGDGTPSTPAVVILDDVGGLSGWDPWDVDRHARELVETWRLKDKLLRSVTITGHWSKPSRWKCELRWTKNGKYEHAMVIGPFAAALTGAVCEAEGLKVKA